MTTGDRIIEAAASLLDAGGGVAVTLRGVAQATGLSHNAPYKHFADRNALLAAVATREFETLAQIFTKIGRERVKPLRKLKRALDAFADYGRRHPHRYELLFSDPQIAGEEGELQRIALKCFFAFAAIVAQCQQEAALPRARTAELAGLLYAAVHGLIDLQASGRLKNANGFTGVGQGTTLLLRLLSTTAASRITPPPP